jgi:hypothetical protein
MFGALLKSVSTRYLKGKRKKGYRKEWIMEISNVPSWAYKAWDSGYIYGDLVKFSKIRDKLKKQIKDKL